MTKKIVLCDMDGILADLTGMIISKVNEEHGLKVTRSDIDKLGFQKLFPGGRRPLEVSQ